MKKIFIILIGIVFLSSCNSKKGIQLSDTKQDCEAKVISVEKIADLLASGNLNGVQFIDIRTPHEFAMGHLPNAINVPMKNFFDKERFEVIDQKDMIILYGDDTSTPKLMGLLVSHFSKGEFSIALGGYDFLKDISPSSVEFNLKHYDDEFPLVDFQKEIDSIVAQSGAAQVTSAKKKPNTVKPLIIKKKKAVSGGCG